MTWSLVFGFNVDILSAIDRSVQTEPGLVRTTTDTARAAAWPDAAAAVDWLRSVGLALGPVREIGTGTGEIAAVPVEDGDAVPCSAKGVAFEWRARDARSASAEAPPTSAEHLSKRAENIPEIIPDDEPFRLEGVPSVKRAKQRREYSPAAGEGGDRGPGAGPMDRREDDRAHIGPAGDPDDRAAGSEGSELPRHAPRTVVTVYRSDCLFYVRAKPVATWSLWSFEPIDPVSIDRGAGRRFVRCDPFPVRIQTTGPAKIVGGRLVHGGDPWEAWCAEMVWILATAGKRGVALASSCRPGTVGILHESRPIPGRVAGPAIFDGGDVFGDVE